MAHENLADVTETVVRTLTVTATPEIPTHTLGRPWTTAAPLIHTNRQPYYTEVLVQYPLQPRPQVWRPCPDMRGRTVGSFFGGLGVGLLICAVIALVLGRKIHRLRKILRRAESGLYAIPVDVEAKANEEPMLSATAQIENEPLLADGRTLVDVEEAPVSGARLLWLSMMFTDKP
ncbi:hypothetical protein FB45DRAFT_868993 [Roridomyces roridus]|uniref:Uncharacterized protein n=1 Tax=Roridomyces roridus TaxID=1738132 RepID=A0AAD7BNP3_9AGAR|nr:hypothetical protein FB45DRAFT_868993 [Roridomyces roridus]